MKDFEMARSDNPEEIVRACQRSFTKAMRDVLADLKKTSKAPGLTWDQIDYFLSEFAKKEPTIVTQEHEQ